VRRYEGDCKPHATAARFDKAEPAATSATSKANAKSTSKPGTEAARWFFMNSDETLILEFQQGAREAFVELFERYREPIYGFFRRRLDYPARAEELAQECFLALLQNVERYEPRASFRSYLYGIAIHLVAAERRKAGREVAENEKLDGRAAEGNAAENNDAGIWVRKALGHLEPSEREILMLREYEQLSYGEIAAVLRMPVNTVRSRLFRARAALKNQLLPVK
jgi:RNA polymerase sigma-70 factor, ECF subfamily